jgi:hypothetical protein
MKTTIKIFTDTKISPSDITFHLEQIIKDAEKLGILSGESGGISKRIYDYSNPQEKIIGTIRLDYKP